MNRLSKSEFFTREEESEPQESAETAEDKAGLCWVWKVGHILGKFRLEILFALYSACLSIPAVSTTTLILDKVCLSSLGQTEAVCDSLANHTDLKTEAERLSTNYQTAYNLLRDIPASLLSFFIGPFSDKYGRIPTVLVAVAGQFLNSLVCTLCSGFRSSSPGYLMIGALVDGISGGSVTNWAFYYAYRSDTSTLKERTIKYLYLEISTSLFSPVGTLIGGWIQNIFGHTAVFLTATVGFSVNFLLLFFWIPETRGLDNPDPLRVKLKDLFKAESLKESFMVTAKNRPQNLRKQVILLLAAMCFLNVSLNSTAQINYLYTFHMYDWSNAYFSTVSGVVSIVTVLATFAAVPTLRHFGVDDPAMGIAGTVSVILGYLVLGLSFTQEVYIAASLLGILQVLAPLAVRSRMSKVAGPDEIGKIFSFVAIASTLLPTVTSIVMTQIFNASLDFFPGMVYIAVLVTLVLPLAVFVWLVRLPPLKYNDNGEIASVEENASSNISLSSNVKELQTVY